MHRQTPLDTSLRAFSSGGSRGVVHEVQGPEEDDLAKAKDVPDGDFLQELKIDMMSDETRERVEHPQNYGFTSHVLKADRKKQGQGGGGGGQGEEAESDIESAAEHFTHFMGGNRTFPVSHLDDRRVRLRCLAEGEVCVYDDQQQKVHIKRDVIETRSQFKIEQKIILDEPKKDGHGWHKNASRDQTKEKSVRLTSLVLDPKQIIIERTKPKEKPEEQKEDKDRSKQDGEWQKDGDDSDAKEIQKCSQFRLTEKTASMMTYKDGEPYLVISLDNDSQQIVLQTLDKGRPRFEMVLDQDGLTQENKERPEEGKPGLVMEMDDQFRRILLMTTRDEKPQLVLELDGPKDRLTIKTNGKTEQVFDNASSTIHIHADTVVKIGDRNADRPVAAVDTVDSAGHRLTGDFLEKVLGK